MGADRTADAQAAAARAQPAVDFREILNAIRYTARSAGGWRILPSEFGPWQTVYWWFRPARLCGGSQRDLVLIGPVTS